MKTESPFKDRPGFLTFEEFYLLPIGTPVETFNTITGRVDKSWVRERISELEDTGSLISGKCKPIGYGNFLGDCGIVPYSERRWNDRHYTRLPQPPSELDKLRQELKAARDTMERLAVQIEEMSK